MDAVRRERGDFLRLRALRTNRQKEFISSREILSRKVCSPLTRTRKVATKRNQVVTDIDSLGANVIFAAYYGDFSEFLFLSNSRKAFRDIFYSSRDVNGPLIVASLETSKQGGQTVFDTVRDISPLGETGINWVTNLVKTM